MDDKTIMVLAFFALVALCALCGAVKHWLDAVAFQRKLETGYEQVAVVIKVYDAFDVVTHDESQIVWQKVQPKKEGVA